MAAPGRVPIHLARGRGLTATHGARSDVRNGLPAATVNRSVSASHVSVAVLVRASRSSERGRLGGMDPVTTAVCAVLGAGIGAGAGRLGGGWSAGAQRLAIGAIGVVFVVSAASPETRYCAFVALLCGCVAFVAVGGLSDP